jgi:hypothetical protein
VSVCAPRYRQNSSTYLYVLFAGRVSPTAFVGRSYVNGALLPWLRRLAAATDMGWIELHQTRGCPPVTVLTAVSTTITVYWDVAESIAVDQRFGAIYCIHLQC